MTHKFHNLLSFLIFIILPTAMAYISHFNLQSPSHHTTTQLFGRGDKRTTRGKRFRHSNGISRPKHKKKRPFIGPLQLGKDEDDYWYNFVHSDIDDLKVLEPPHVTRTPYELKIGSRPETWTHLTSK
mmetsp:Transcript_47466/g.60953  ORF Transcript_47466/g.60953 Transcript_47466/m.60953 type:complete len:127 (-) Transcript_47466:260-640(-)